MATKTAVSILEEARANIKKSNWICGALDACTVSKKGKLKHMACAVGILSLAAGGKAVRKRTQNVPVGNFKWLNTENGFDFLYDDDEPESVAITTFFATYPDEKWSKAAKEAAQCLALAVPEGIGVFGRDFTVPEYASGTYEAWDGPRTVDPFGREALHIYSNAITDYNDSHITTAAEARKWFTQAIKLARAASAK